MLQKDSPADSQVRLLQVPAALLHVVQLPAGLLVVLPPAACAIPQNSNSAHQPLTGVFTAFP